MTPTIAANFEIRPRKVIDWHIGDVTAFRIPRWWSLSSHVSRRRPQSTKVNCSCRRCSQFCCWSYPTATKARSYRFVLAVELARTTTTLKTRVCQVRSPSVGVSSIYSSNYDADGAEVCDRDRPIYIGPSSGTDSHVPTCTFRK